MKTIVALLTALAIAISPAHAEPKQKPPCQEASLVVEGLIMAWMIGVAAYFIGSAYSSYKSYERAREQNGGQPVEQICKWQPIEKK